MGEATGAAGQATPNAATTDNPQSKDNIFDNRPTHKKLVRVVTVMAYLFSVSFVAIALSGYYVFIWRPPNRGSSSRAQTMSEAQAQLFAENVPAEYPVIDNNTNIHGIYNEMKILRNEISQPGNMNISLNGSFQSNDGILNSTSALVNPISTQMYQNKTDKVTTDTRSDIYGILHSSTDVSFERKNLETSTLFMNESNIERSLTATDFPFSTDRIITKKKVSSPDRTNVHDQYIEEDQVPNTEEVLWNNQQKFDDNNQTVIATSTVYPVEISPTESDNSSTRGYNNEKIMKIPSQNNAELSKKLKDIHPPLPIRIKERQALPEQIQEETFSDSSTITSPNINEGEVISNNSDGKKMNQYNLPKR